MKKTLCTHKYCSVETTANLIGKKWTILVIKELLEGPKRFNELLELIDGICPRSLSLRLKELQTNKLINKKILKTIPVKIEYSLTDKGMDLASIVQQMRKWGDKYGN